MSGAAARIRSVYRQLLPAQSSTTSQPHIHELSPTYFLPRAAAIEPDADAIVHVNAAGEGVRRSYAELAARSADLAYYLKKQGWKRVGLLMPNTPAHLESIFGVVAAGGATVPVNYRLKEEDISYILGFGEVECVIVDEEYVGLLGAFRRDHPKIPLIVDTDTIKGGAYNDALKEGQEYDRSLGSQSWAGLHPHALDENEMLAIPFTSGTTSKPKGCVYTHRGAYLAALGNVVESGLNTGRCKYLWTLPMFHAVGWTFPWAVTAVRGVHYCLRKVDYPFIWKLLKEEGITHFNAAPTVNTLLVAAKEAAKLPRPVQVTVAASPPSGYLFEQMTKLNLHPVHVYGMTETYGPITKCYLLPEWDSLPAQEKYAKMARQGHGFVTSRAIRVIKTDQPEDIHVDVARDGKEIGEIICYGNICAKEYFKDPAATKKLFSGGALHSGDLAVCHPDGSAQILDRAKDIIISGGENISSVALESMLVEHPDILEAGVIAVPDDHWGEIPKAYITVKEGKNLREHDVISWAKDRSNISRFMIPKAVEVLEELPKTSTGKIKKNELRDLARKGSKA